MFKIWTGICREGSYFLQTEFATLEEAISHARHNCPQNAVIYYNEHPVAVFSPFNRIHVQWVV
jgi:hypothetical protein